MDEELKKDRAHLVDYLKHRVDVEDWHGVQDAASDLREVDAKLQLLEQLRSL